LNKNQLQSRIDDNLINAFDNGKTKTYKQIFKDNIFTLFNLINNLLALISCITPIIVLITAININKVFLKEPTETNKQTKTIFM
ncbi:hypothetical protein ACTPEF_26935, partial [Clostridioides difficile]